jgi:3',5'-cyclic AMP phosphodiesterase CpdA
MPRWTFLFITDLHFASPETNFSDDPKELDKKHDQVLRDQVIPDFHAILNFDFRELANHGCIDPLTFIAIGGDITTHGREQGLDRFKTKTFPLLEKLVNKPEAICIVPGNHDVAWGLNPRSPDYFDQKFEPFRRGTGGRGMTTCLYPTGPQDVNDPWDDRLLFHMPPVGPIYSDEKKKVLVLTINSAIRCAEFNLKMASDLNRLLAPASTQPDEKLAVRDFHESMQRYLIRDVAHVTQAQILKLEALLEEEKAKIGNDWSNYLRVALIHHHLGPFRGQKTEHKGYEAMLDSSRVLEFLTNFGFDLVLSGHKHQAYVSRSGPYNEEIVLVGGPTVGGANVDGSFRGFHFVEVTSDGRGRQVRVWDIPNAMPRGNLRVNLEKRRPPEPNAVLSAHPALITAANERGFQYKDVVSITRILEEGDAHRVVEWDDLVISKENTPRRQSHSFQLPHTSGYLDFLQVTAQGNDFDVRVNKPIPAGLESSSATVELGFRPSIAVGKKARYQYEWYTVNGFALDGVQFVRKYGTNVQDKDPVEFTQFIPVDPMERLTVVVQFPTNSELPRGVRLRIMKVNPQNVDSNSWEPDEDERNHLDHICALRFYKTLNIAALRVKVPKADLSYGIEWTVPEATSLVRPIETETITARLLARPEETLKRLGSILKESRKNVFPRWTKDLDANLMIFNMAPAGGILKTVSAGLMRGDFKPIEPQTIESGLILKYGEGIAGRAFKVNGIRIYRDPSIDDPRAFESPTRKFGRDFYKPVPGTIPHKVLISFPVHVPVPEAEFTRDEAAYKLRQPYGVISIASTIADCPLGELNRQAPVLLRFQHAMNKVLAGA